eukprot:6752102-Alexandrium_andersonii.AAC.1
MDRFDEIAGTLEGHGTGVWRRRGQESNQDLWWVLMEKTSGEALQRVKGAAAGEGFEVYRKARQ